ncbi:GNAT family N-acetyltransferase [Paenibacillus humicola]|uniref:GNAT family N-acetyltransferase n=1 Tax=Paenibacillus humicola TaxID=3110540 RepID=UPI00237A0DCB|nr:GNAT family N-acetyltransferase [Paenibacillus humicola]
MDANQAAVNTQQKLIQDEGYEVLEIVRSDNGCWLIVYSPPGRYDLYGRVVYPTGVATSRHRNDLVFFVRKKPAEPALTLQYIRILGDKINQGYGSAMMRNLLQMAENAGIATIDGRMRDSDNKEHDERLRHFYTKFGFEIGSDRSIRRHAKKGSPP